MSEAIIFPAFLKKGDFIGVTALSDGNQKEVDFNRLENGKKNLSSLGYPVIETKNVRKSEKGRSSSGKVRSGEFLELLLNDQVTAIFSAKGGDFLLEMLPFLDFEQIKQHPKWIQGYSDNTGILFPITTICNIATIYGNNFNDFGMEVWHESVLNNLALLEGRDLVQKSFSLYEDGFHEKITGLEGYMLEKPVWWKNAREEEEIRMEGHLLGGCLDVLLNLVGTRYDFVKEYSSKHKEEGILWFLESFDLGSEALIRGLWQLREAGWFQYAAGFLFGRPCMFSSFTDTTYQEAVLSVLGECNVPIILDADIGHKGPSFSMVNGAFGRVQSADGKGEVRMNLCCR